MSTIKIRKIEQKDNADVAQIIRSCFYDFNACTQGTVFEDPTTDDLFSLFKTEKSVLWIVEENGKPVGCCGIFPTEGLPQDCAELVKFYIGKEARGKGLGKILMQQSIASAKELGYKQIYLESIPAFSKAVSIYEKQGFTYLDKPLGNSGHSGCDLWMIKNINKE